METSKHAGELVRSLEEMRAELSLFNGSMHHLVTTNSNLTQKLEQFQEEMGTLASNLNNNSQILNRLMDGLTQQIGEKSSHLPPQS